MYNFQFVSSAPFFLMFNPFTHFVQIFSVIVQVSAGAYFFVGFVDWLPLLVVVILGWLFLRRGGVFRAADVDLYI